VLGHARARMASTWTKQLFLAGLRVVIRTCSPATTKSESPDLPVGAFVFLILGIVAATSCDGKAWRLATNFPSA